MPLISKNIPNMVNGVSQQPAPLRLDTSCERLINGYPSVITGLQKRPNTKFFTELTGISTTSESAAIHVVNRDNTEKYMIVVGNGTIDTYDLITGNQIPIDSKSDVDYLNTPTPNEDIKFLTIADSTFILNRRQEITTANVADGAVSAAGTKGSVYVQQSIANVEYAVYINGVKQGNFTTGANVDLATALEGTEEIAREIGTSMTNNGVTGVQVIGSVVSFDVTPGTSLRVLEGFGGRSMTAYVDEVQSFSDLPPDEISNRVVRIAGSVDSSLDDYYVIWNGEVWRETAKQGSRLKLSEFGMPHLLVRKTNGNFDFAPTSWGERAVGDNDTNTVPTFVGRTINDIFLYRNRMGFLSDENIIFSEIGNFENFFRTSVVQLLDSDPIDIASTTSQVSVLQHAIPYANSLSVYSSRVQFQLADTDVLSPQTVSIDVSTYFDNSKVCKPINSGPNVFFAVDGDEFASVRELFLDSTNNTSDAVEVTIQIPRYIPSPIVKMTTSTKEDIMVSLSAADRTKLFVYKWYYAGKEKIQSAWNVWEFNDGREIMTIEFLDEDLLMVYKLKGKVYADTMDVSEGTEGILSNSQILLDSSVDSVDLPMSYDSGTDKTTITMPYDLPQFQEYDIEGYETLAARYGYVLSGDGSDVNAIMNVTGTRTIVADGDLTNRQFTLGVPYTFLYEYSRQYNRDGDEGGLVAVQDGRLQLRYFSVLYVNATRFDVTVSPDGRNDYNYLFNSRRLGDSTSLIGEYQQRTGEFRFPIFARSDKVKITITNDSPFGSIFSTTEWEGFYNGRTQRA